MVFAGPQTNTVTHNWPLIVRTVNFIRLDPLLQAHQQGIFVQQVTDGDSLCISITSWNNLASVPIKGFVATFTGFYRRHIFNVIGDDQVRPVSAMSNATYTLFGRYRRNPGFILWYIKRRRTPFFALFYKWSHVVFE